MGIYPDTSAKLARDRTIKSFHGFFDMLGPQRSAAIQFVCSDMWKPYLHVIRERCSQALPILGRFHIVAKLAVALVSVEAARQFDGPPDIPEIALYHALGKLLQPKLTHEFW